MYRVEVLGGDVDTLSSIAIREDGEVSVANHTGEVSGQGGKVAVSFFRGEFVGVVDVVHGEVG